MPVNDADRERSDLNTLVQDDERRSLATTGRLPNSGFRNAAYTSAKARATSAATSHARSSTRRPPRNPSSRNSPMRHPTAYSVVNALLKMADSAGVDLIVVGSVGFNSVVESLIGSVPRAVRHRAKAVGCRHEVETSTWRSAVDRVARSRTVTDATHSGQQLRTTGVDFYEDEAMRFLVILASFVAVLGVATPVQADPGTSGPDASFLVALTNAGITFQDPTVAVAVAKKACALMDQGNPQAGAIKSVSSSNPEFSPDGAAKFTMIAASAYCPPHLGQPVAPAPPTQ
jgi:Protein of unknown function (DUF732)